jgi:hypothetical protein
MLKAAGVRMPGMSEMGDSAGGSPSREQIEPLTGQCPAPGVNRTLCFGARLTLTALMRPQLGIERFEPGVERVPYLCAWLAGWPTAIPDTLQLSPNRLYARGLGHGAPSVAIAADSPAIHATGRWAPMFASARRTAGTHPM